MHSLAELQGRFAHALTTGAGGALVAELVGGADPGLRLAIHLRHYDASLVAALCDKFPACAWLAGPDFVRGAARAYARAQPPSQPCIAEYGRNFPQFLAAYGCSPSLPYLASFAALEWAVAQASIAIERTPRSWPEVSRLGAERLVDSTLVLQPGLHYLQAEWRVDELMTTFLSGAAPERFVLVEASTFIEIRGARGDVRVARIDGATFVFRTALKEGLSLGEAATRALECDATFDAGAALRALAIASLITATSITAQEHPS